MRQNKGWSVGRTRHAKNDLIIGDSLLRGVKIAYCLIITSPIPFPPPYQKKKKKITRQLMESVIHV